MTPKEFKTFRDNLGYSKLQMAEELRLKSERIITMYEKGERGISGPITLCLDYIKKHGLLTKKKSEKKRKEY